MVTKMKAFVRPRCTEITMDDRVNSRGRVLMNIYQMLLLGAIKTLSYVKSLKGGLGQNEPFIYRSILDLFSYVYSLLHKRVAEAGGESDVAKSEVFYLGFVAFTKVFKKGMARAAAAASSSSSAEGNAILALLASGLSEVCEGRSEGGENSFQSTMKKVTEMGDVTFDLKDFDF